MNKIKAFFFGILKKIFGILSKLGVNHNTPGAFLIYNFLFRHFWPYGSIVEIQGSQMFMNINDESPGIRTTFQSYASNKTHEETTTALFKKVIKKGDVVVDLGANIGYFTLLAAKLVGKDGKVFSFEPEPKNYNYLKKNIELNNYSNVFAFQKAVSNKDGRTTLFICAYDSGHHTINRDAGIEAYRRGRAGETKEVEVELVRLDSFLEGKVDKVDVMKIDVEGSELLAIEGSKGILDKNKNIKIFLEFFPLLIKEMGSSPEVLIRELIEEHQFNIFVIGHDYAMEKSKEQFLRVTNYKEVMSLLRDKSDHINLYVSREKEIQQ